VFGFRSNLYQDVAELELPQRKFKAFGVGAKAYHENIDDLYFPSKGNRVMISYQKSFAGVFSDESYEKTYLDLFNTVPLNSSLSVQASMEAGMFRNVNLGILFSPFQIGGIDSYTGMEKHRHNYEVFQNYRVGLLYNYEKRYFINVSGQILYKGDLIDFGEPSKVIDLTLGYKFPIGPLRMTISYDLESKINYFLSFGYTKDMFKFSRH
jgi:outer membrane protein assembly factor BamA